jgi:hypothetical protein
MSEGAAQDGGGPVHVAGLQGFAHGAGRQFQPVGVIQPLGHRNGEAQPLAIGLQGLGRAGPPLAEGEVEADGGVANAQPPRQHRFGEVGVGHAGHLAVEGQQIQDVHPQGRQGLGHLVRRHQAKGRGVGLEPAARMGIETDDTPSGAPSRSAASFAPAMTA